MLLEIQVAQCTAPCRLHNCYKCKMLGNWDALTRSSGGVIKYVPLLAVPTLDSSITRIIELHWMGNTRSLPNRQHLRIVILVD